MTLPDDHVTPTPDETPDPVAATVPDPDPAPEDAPVDAAELPQDDHGILPGVFPVRPVGDQQI